MAGERGFYEELAALKGELPKVEFEPIRQAFTQENVDRLPLDKLVILCYGR